MIRRDDIKTVLVRCPNWVGDIVMATPVFACLRRAFAGARLVGAVRGYARGILADGPWFDEVIDADDKSWGGLVRLSREIRQVRADLAVVLPNSFRSVLPVRLGGARCIIGYKRGLRSLLLTDGPVAARDGRGFAAAPMGDYYMGLCRFLGLEEGAESKPRLYIGAEQEAQGQRLLERYGITPEDRVIGLNVGAKFGSSKCWPAGYFARTADLLQEHLPAKLLLLVGPGEEPIAEAIRGQTRADVIDTGPDRVDLALLKPLVRRCNLLITNDTGPRHYAVAFDVAVVVIMGPTDPRWTAAHLERTIVLRRELPCSPCHLKTCPSDHRCMREISPEAVVAAAQKLLRETT